WDGAGPRIRLPAHEPWTLYGAELAVGRVQGGLVGFDCDDLRRRLPPGPGRRAGRDGAAGPRRAPGRAAAPAASAPPPRGRPPAPRPAQLPLPPPRDARAAAGRVNDLLHAERHREARALVEQFRDAPAEPEDRFALLRAALHGAALSGTRQGVADDAADLVTLLRRSGAALHAAAVVALLLERGPFTQDAPSRTAREEPQPNGRGRRRGEVPQASPELLVVVRAMERSAVTDPRGTAADPRRDVARLRAALTALPAVREKLLTDPE